MNGGNNKVCVSECVCERHQKLWLFIIKIVSYSWIRCHIRLLVRPNEWKDTQKKHNQQQQNSDISTNVGIPFAWLRFTRLCLARSFSTFENTLFLSHSLSLALLLSLSVALASSRTRSRSHSLSSSFSRRFRRYDGWFCAFYNSFSFGLSHVLRIKLNRRIWLCICFGLCFGFSVHKIDLATVLPSYFCVRKWDAKQSCSFGNIQNDLNVWCDSYRLIAVLVAFLLLWTPFFRKRETSQSQSPSHLYIRSHRETLTHRHRDAERKYLELQFQQS